MSNSVSLPGDSRGRSLKIAVRLFDARESWHLSRTLEMAARVAGQPVEMETPAGSADVVFVSPEEPGADAILGGRPGPGLPLAIAYSAEPLPGVRCLGRPARMQEVRELLEEVAALAALGSGGATLAGAVAAPAPAKAASAPPITVAPAVMASAARTGIPFAVSNLGYLLDSLLESRFAGDPLRIRRGEDEFIFLPRHHKVFSRRKAHLEELADALREVAQPDIRAIATAEASGLISSGDYHVVPMEAMAWQLAMLASPQPVASSALPDHRLRLKRWPNFAILPHRPFHLSWAAQLSRASLPLPALVAQAPGGFDPVARFANACSLLGILDMGATVPATAPAAAASAVLAGGAGPDRPGIFQKLLNRLGR